MSTTESGFWTPLMEPDIRGTIDLRLMCLMLLNFGDARGPAEACSSSWSCWLALSVEEWDGWGRVRRIFARLPLYIWKGLVWVMRGIWLRPSWFASLSEQQACLSSGTFEMAFSSSSVEACRAVLRSPSLKFVANEPSELWRCLKKRSFS